MSRRKQSRPTQLKEKETKGVNEIGKRNGVIPLSTQIRRRTRHQVKLQAMESNANPETMESMELDKCNEPSAGAMEKKEQTPTKSADDTLGPAHGTRAKMVSRALASLHPRKSLRCRKASRPSVTERSPHTVGRMGTRNTEKSTLFKWKRNLSINKEASAVKGNRNVSSGVELRSWRPRNEDLSDTNTENRTTSSLEVSDSAKQDSEKPGESEILSEQALKELHMNKLDLIKVSSANSVLNVSNQNSVETTEMIEMNAVAEQKEVEKREIGVSQDDDKNIPNVENDVETSIWPTKTDIEMHLNPLYLLSECIEDYSRNHQLSKAESEVLHLDEQRHFAVNQRETKVDSVRDINHFGEKGGLADSSASTTNSKPKVFCNTLPVSQPTISWSCEVCGRSFKSYHSMQAHTKTVRHRIKAKAGVYKLKETNSNSLVQQPSCSDSTFGDTEATLSVPSSSINSRKNTLGMFQKSDLPKQPKQPSEMFRENGCALEHNVPISSIRSSCLIPDKINRHGCRDDHYPESYSFTSYSLPNHYHAKRQPGIDSHSPFFCHGPDSCGLTCALPTSLKFTSPNKVQAMAEMQWQRDEWENSKNFPEKVVATMVEAILPGTKHQHVFYKCYLCGCCFPSLGVFGAHLSIHCNQNGQECESRNLTLSCCSKMDGQIHSLSNPTHCSQNIVHDVHCAHPCISLDTLNNMDVPMEIASFPHPLDGTTTTLSSEQSHLPETLLRKAACPIASSSESASDIPHCEQPNKMVETSSETAALADVKSEPKSRRAISKNPKEKTFECRFCTKTFSRLFSLQRHERVHTGYKPCTCSVCGQGFSEKRNLRHHVIRFHSDTDMRDKLRKHMRMKCSFYRQKQNKSNKLVTFLKKTAVRILNTVEQSRCSPTAIEETNPLRNATPSDNSQFHISASERELQHPARCDALVVTVEDGTFTPSGHVSHGTSEVSVETLCSPNILYHSDESYLAGNALEKVSGSAIPIRCQFREEQTRATPEIIVETSDPTATDNFGTTVFNGITSESGCTDYNNGTVKPTTSKLKDYLENLEAWKTSQMIPSRRKGKPYKYTGLEDSSQSAHTSEESDPSPVKKEMCDRNGNDSESPVDIDTVECISSPEMFSTIEVREDKNLMDYDPAPTKHKTFKARKGRHGAFLSSYNPRLGVVEIPVVRKEVCKPQMGPDGKFLYPCSYCDKSFCSSSDLNRHMDFHEDVRPFHCPLCSYSSRTNSQLKVHMMRHQGIKQFMCNICNYNGVTQSDLNRHFKTRTHVLRLQNICEICGLGFYSRPCLEGHIQLFHEQKSDTDKLGKHCTFQIPAAESILDECVESPTISTVKSDVLRNTVSMADHCNDENNNNDVEFKSKNLHCSGKTSEVDQNTILK